MNIRPHLRQIGPPLFAQRGDMRIVGFKIAIRGDVVVNHPPLPGEIRNNMVQLAADAHMINNMAVKRNFL